ncbi:hypothetical protein TWF569_003149 [Orbilia oligospora]|uniref:Essential protein Yae1 N-terminal domain-containing protein n=1 Tax=Orbilia oligospora TaxID=2813651 RepID=A0A7C8NJY2_ORBOL|nr:hypothetical protein TWF102_010622 [Orbilia oligospora]KAF3100482.1 hypothetical protein TWF103_008207 [Orbilia oligospora]KAF3110926.1 hypothetical protein TWF706_000388 [Orbilia oligospora]KAF3120411.1 hypothetical protein TWF569_003149 [Orbilia oligospora]KAF3139058.1 hypothetical protein TWF594_006812 [Orbilia oligospora]
MSTVSTMSSLDASSSVRTKTGKLDSRSVSKIDRDASQAYKLHCVPKSSKKNNQPKPLPKPALDEYKDGLSPSRTLAPQTPQKSAEKQFKQTIEGFEKQLKIREAAITGSLEQKLATSGKENASTSIHAKSALEESEGLLALYEEAPATETQIEDLDYDQYETSRANLLRLCKVAYERGRRDGSAEDRKKMKEECYCRGFKEGHKEGRDEGWKEGYCEGYDEGYMKGREYGDKKIEKEINEAIAELTKNPNAFLTSSEYLPWGTVTKTLDILTIFAGT